MTKVHAELGVLPIGTSTPSLGKYIAHGLKRLGSIDGIRYQTTPMGTIMEAESIDKIFEAAKAVSDSIFEMGVSRVETILKIDQRRDKDHTLEDKMKSLTTNQ